MTISHKPVDNALHPAWRNAAVHFITSESWNDKLPTSAAEAAIAHMTNDTGYALRQLAPDSGVYYNEVSLMVPSLNNIKLLTGLRQILGNQTGSGRFGDRIIPGSFQSRRNMIQGISCGVITV